MKIQLRYDNQFTTFELNLDEVKGWLNISALPDETEEAFQARVQKKVDVEYNRPEYNSMHKQERHKGYSKFAEDEHGDYFEPNMNDVKDSSVFLKTQNDIRNAEDYKAIESFVYSVLKPDVADLFIAVRLDGMSINDQAVSMLSRDAFETEAEYNKTCERLANNITQKLKRAAKKLEKNFSKASDFGICRGYHIGGNNSSTKN